MDGKKQLRRGAPRGNQYARKSPEGRIPKQYSMTAETLAKIDAIRAETGETASAVVARAVSELAKKI